MEGVAHPIRVFSDHKNPEYFSQARTTSRRHARWAATLAAFNYTISVVVVTEWQFGYPIEGNTAPRLYRDREG